MKLIINPVEPPADYRPLTLIHLAAAMRNGWNTTDWDHLVAPRFTRAQRWLWWQRLRLTRKLLTWRRLP